MCPPLASTKSSGSTEFTWPPGFHNAGIHNSCVHCVKVGFHTAAFFAWAEKACELFFGACLSKIPLIWRFPRLTSCSRAALELGGKVELILILSAFFCSIADLASDNQSRSSIWQIWLETFQDGSRWRLKGILRRRRVRNTNINPKLVVRGISPTSKTIAERPRTAVQCYWALNTAEAIIFFLWRPC